MQTHLLWPWQFKIDTKGCIFNIYYFIWIDPSQWSETHVMVWLKWIAQEFNILGINPANFTMRGKDLCQLKRDEFLDLAPPYLGEIMWEHLEILKKGNKWLPKHAWQLR